MNPVPTDPPRMLLVGSSGPLDSRIDMVTTALYQPAPAASAPASPTGRST